MSDRHVVLVAGPPCAGKSTWVNRQRRPGDVVVDYDEIACGFGSTVKWVHAESVKEATEARIDGMLDEIAAMCSGRAWVIRCAPQAQLRAGLARRVRADRVVVLLPPLGVLMERARRRPLAGETRQAIWRWRDRYEPDRGDDVVKG